MREPTLDPERLAALLDGRLDERAREELLEELALSRDDLEILAEAAAVSRELEEEDAAPAELEGSGPVAPVLPINSAPSRRPPIAPPRRWLAIAAVVAGLALVPVLWRGMGGPAGGLPVEALSAPAAGLPAGWDGSPWDATRSPDAALDERVRAVRLGARLADLELALRAGSPDADLLAARAGQLLEGLPGALPLVDAVSDAASGAGPAEERVERVRAVREQAVRLVPAEWVALGEWAEVSRVAAARRDAAYFGSDAFEAGLKRAGGLAAGTGAAEHLDAVRAALAEEGGPGWERLGEALGGVLADVR